jgi:hypothetical protein
MMRYWPRFYVLNEDHSLRQIHDALEWGHEFGRQDRRVAWTGNKSKFVSTVFIGLDHRAFGNGPPLVFETIAFVDEGKTIKGLDGKERPYHTTMDMARYSSWDDAETGHKAMVRKYLINQKTRAVKAE